jgi:hypothetical protein
MLHEALKNPMTYILLALLLAGVYIHFTAYFVRPKVSVVKLSGGAFIFRDYAGKTRDLSQYFRQLEPDLNDYYQDYNIKVKFPLAALYQHNLDVLSKPGLYRCSIGFFDRSASPEAIKFFKKEGYKVFIVPGDTSCATCEFPYRFDLALMYVTVSMKCYSALKAYFSNVLKSATDCKEQVCLELYYKEQQKVVCYVPLERGFLFQLNSLRLPDVSREKIL